MQKNHATRLFELFCAKNRSKKHQILEKGDNFENQPSCKGYSPCKVREMVSLGQFGSKIKNAKNMRKTILQDY